MEFCEEDTYFTRIIYDTEGEPLGFLLNDALPFLYTKNILGDITGVINYETSEYLFRYSYDAYGNYELIPTGNDVASVLLSTILSGLNPLSYRGYIFTPAIGVSHYLGSRFYVPTLCRFMNADVYYDTGNSAVGANMFAYCDNSPVCLIDPNGKAAFAIKALVTKVFNVISTFSASVKEIYTALKPMLNRIAFDYTNRGNLKQVIIYVDKNMSDTVYKYYTKNANRTIGVITEYVVETFYKKYKRHIVFSDNCLSKEIEMHLKGYWWCEGGKNIILPHYLLLAYGIVESVSIYRIDISKKLIDHCNPINISESDIFDIKQRLGFLYRSGIRKIYLNTTNDPFYDPDDKIRKLTPRTNWNIT